MAHAQKLDFVFHRNGRVHLNRRGASVPSTTGSRGVRISGSNAGYTKFRGSVRSTGYPLHSPVSPSLTLLCVTVCHHISAGVYLHCFVPVIIFATTLRSLSNLDYICSCKQWKCNNAFLFIVALKSKVKVSHNRPRWPKGFRVG